MRAIRSLALTFWRASPGTKSLPPAWRHVGSPIISRSNNTSLAAAKKVKKMLPGSGLPVRNTVHNQHCGRGAGSTLRSKPGSHPVSGWIPVTTWRAAQDREHHCTRCCPLHLPSPPLRRVALHIKKRKYVIPQPIYAPNHLIHPSLICPSVPSFYTEQHKCFYIYCVIISFYFVFFWLCIFAHSEPSRLLLLSYCFYLYSAPFCLLNQL